MGNGVEEIKPVIEFQNDVESQGDKLARKTKESPFMVVGIAGLLSAVGVGAYQFKRKGKMSTSVFLMQFRVIAQGTVVGALTAGVCYSIYTNYIKKRPSIQ